MLLATLDPSILTKLKPYDASQVRGRCCHAPSALTHTLHQLLTISLPSISKLLSVQLLQCSAIVCAHWILRS